MPRAGEVVHAQDIFEEPAGGGAVVAVQLARLAGDSLFITALGDDDPGRRSQARLRELGVDVQHASCREPTRRAVTLVDDDRERTITTFGERLQPLGADATLPWAKLAEMDAVYFTAGDVAALRAARAARVLVANPRALDALGHGVKIDALVLSKTDDVELHAAERAEGETELSCSPKARPAAATARATGAPGAGSPCRRPASRSTPTAAATHSPPG